MNTNKREMVKMNISIEKKFYETLQDLAERDHLKVTTWTKQFLMRQVEDLLNYKTFTNDYPF